MRTTGIVLCGAALGLGGYLLLKLTICTLKQRKSKAVINKLWDAYWEL